MMVGGHCCRTRILRSYIVVEGEVENIVAVADADVGVGQLGILAWRCPEESVQGDWEERSRSLSSGAGVRRQQSQKDGGCWNCWCWSQDCGYGRGKTVVVVPEARAVTLEICFS